MQVTAMKAYQFGRDLCRWPASFEIDCPFQTSHDSDFLLAAGRHVTRCCCALFRIEAVGRGSINDVTSHSSMSTMSTVSSLLLLLLVGEVFCKDKLVLQDHEYKIAIFADC